MIQSNQHINRVLSPVCCTEEAAKQRYFAKLLTAMGKLYQLSAMAYYK